MNASESRLKNVRASYVYESVKSETNFGTVIFTNLESFCFGTDFVFNIMTKTALRSAICTGCYISSQVSSSTLNKISNHFRTHGGGVEIL